MKISLQRSLAKALTYRVWQSLNTFLISWAITGKIDIAIAIVSIEIVLKIIIYFFHELIWNKINWGVKNV
jgi:uncharacterized membrane protein